MIFGMFRGRKDFYVKPLKERRPGAHVSEERLHYEGCRGDWWRNPLVALFYVTVLAGFLYWLHIEIQFMGVHVP